MKFRFVREVKPSGDIYYYTEKRHFFTWRYVGGSMSCNEKSARDLFNYLIKNAKQTKMREVITILEEKEV